MYKTDVSVNLAIPVVPIGLFTDYLNELLFQLVFLVTRNCGKTTFSGDRGTISSPNYPRNYPSDTFCVFTVEAPPSTAVKF